MTVCNRIGALAILAAGAVAIAASPSCARNRMPAPHPPLAHADPVPAQLEVGAARVDITPPPGASLFGHGPGARVAVGYWTRLLCRAFYLTTRDRIEPGLAIVACDLPQVSTVLQRRVAVRIHPVLPTSNLLLLATHTHAGPGHFFDSENLGGAASSHFPGYDDAMVEFLSKRIAEAVVQARQNRRAAQMRWVKSSAWQLTRNRSLAAHRLNRKPYPVFASVPANLSPEERAIDPALRVLEFEALDEATPGRRPVGPIGSITFFAMHPTVVGNVNRYYGGDVFGVATRLVERELQQEWALLDPRYASCQTSERESNKCVGVQRREVVHAVVNTNFGDMTPVRTWGNAEEAIRVGTRLAEQIWQAHCAPAPAADAAGTAQRSGPPGSSPRAYPLCPKPDQDGGQRPASARPWRKEAVLDSRYMEVTLPEAPARVGSWIDSPPKLCAEPEIGVAAARGASDHPTVVEWLLPSGVDTADYDRTDCQAPKRQLFAGGFPEQIPLTLLRLDDTAISFVPGELTIMTGEQINQEVRGIGSRFKLWGDALVAGIANGYIQYVATYEEYQMQRYEGASTLYGPWTATYLAESFRFLARHMAGEEVGAELAKLMNDPDGDRELGAAEPFEYEISAERERLWRSEWDTPIEELYAQRSDPLNVTLCTVPESHPPNICMQWVDGGPGRFADIGAPWLELVHAPPGRSTVKVAPPPLDSDTADSARTKLYPIDDRSFFFFTRAIAPQGDAYRWATVFRPSHAVWNQLATQQLRFRARSGSSQPDVVSDWFTRGRLPRPCNARELRSVCASP